MRGVCRLLAAVLLLTQLMVSAYACPGLPQALNAATQAAVAHDGPPAPPTALQPAEHGAACADMHMPADAGFANLCAEHCHQGQQSDAPPLPPLPVVLFAALYLLPTGAPPTAAPARPDVNPARAATAPPLAILHCCFRI